MTSNDPHIVIEHNEPLEISYRKPKFWHRVIANLIDFLLLVLVFFVLFISCRAIVQSTSTYKEKDAELKQMRLDSGLYYESEEYGVRDIIAYLNLVDLSSYVKMTRAESAINTFLSYCDEVCEPEKAAEIRETYDTERLDTETFSDDNGVAYFVYDTDGETIIRNSECSATNQEYFDNFYTYYIDEVLHGYLVIAIPNYYELTKYESNMLIYAEILPSYLVAGVLIYYVPTLFFRKGRKTLGKAIYHIGLIDKRFLNPTWKRSLARFLIFYFFEYLLSVFTFGIPLIISFSLMAFSKNRQGFPDYMLSLMEIDTSNYRIFDSYDEITIDRLTNKKEPVDFKQHDPYRR